MPLQTVLAQDQERPGEEARPVGGAGFHELTTVTTDLLYYLVFAIPTCTRDDRPRPRATPSPTRARTRPRARGPFAPSKAKAIISGTASRSKGRFCAVAATSRDIFCLIVSGRGADRGICFLGAIAASSLLPLTRRNGRPPGRIAPRPRPGPARPIRRMPRPRPRGGSDPLLSLLLVNTIILTNNKVNCCFGVCGPGRRTPSLRSSCYRCRSKRLRRVTRRPRSRSAPP